MGHRASIFTVPEWNGAGAESTLWSILAFFAVGICVPPSSPQWNFATGDETCSVGDPVQADRSGGLLGRPQHDLALSLIYCAVVTAGAANRQAVGAAQ